MSNQNQNSNIITAVAKLLEIDLPDINHIIEIEDLINYLQPVVKKYLINDTEKLLHILYTIDVNETKVNIALQANSTEEVAKEIARLIVERQLEKIKWREKYKDL